MAKIENVSLTQNSTRSKFVNLVLAGIIATVAFDMVMYADMAITGVPLDIPKTLGSLAVGESQFASPVGHLIHLGNGISIALVFGYVALPISKRIAKTSIIVYAISFAVVETVVALWFGMLPAIGGGIAGLEISPLVPAMTMIRHLVLGLVLGLVLRGKIN